MKTERRNVGQPARLVEDQRAAPGARKITGHAAVFYDGTEATEFRMAERVVERVMRGAFDKAIQGKDPDIVALFNHNPDNLLGRRSSETLKIGVDGTGLWYEVNLPETGTGRDVLALASRGDIRGSSFSFDLRGEEGADWRKENGILIRELRDVILQDVGPVTDPAYPAATAEARSLLGSPAGEIRAASGPTTIQSLIFDKAKFTVAEAKKWAKDHDFHSGKIDEPEGGDTIRLRQEEPGDFDPDGFAPGEKFRFIRLADGVQATIGVLRKDAGKERSRPEPEPETAPGPVLIARARARLVEIEVGEERNILTMATPGS